MANIRHNGWAIAHEKWSVWSKIKNTEKVQKRTLGPHYSRYVQKAAPKNT